MTEDPEITYKPTNREKSQVAKRVLVWCGSCDRQLVGETGKCPVCGSRNKPRKKRIALPI